MLTLAGCAAPTAEQPGSAQDAQDQPTTETTAQAEQGAGARQIVKPAEASRPRLDLSMTSEGANALAAPVTAPNAAVPPPSREPWQPDWYTGSVIEKDGLRIGSAVATNRDLLEARRLAVTAALDLLEGVIDQTVTRQLDNGQYRVWVRVAADN